MKKYQAFISYRKAHETNADLVKTTLVEEYGFSDKSIFLDKHHIGPEYFDTKLKIAVESSECLVLLVTKDCFIPKDGEEDFFIKEIKTALENNITIIPLLFDDIKTLSQKDIVEQLKKSFTEDEINRLTKTQAIRYDFELSEASFKKLANFIRQANTSKLSNIFFYSKVGLVGAAIIAILFILFVGIGFLWGYLSSGTDDKDILIENTYIEGNTAIFDFGGLKAKYDLDADSIFIDLNETPKELPQSNFEILAQSCTVSGAFILLNNNLACIKYLKFLKGGSKQSKMVLAGITVGACVGAFCGFSQGSKWGRTLKQQSEALALFPRLNNRLLWGPVFKDNRTLSFKYNNNITKNTPKQEPVSPPKVDDSILNSINTLTFISPDTKIKTAQNAGLHYAGILCKYNDWEIGKNSYAELNNVIEKSRNTQKNVIFIEGNPDKLEIKEMNLPAGLVGITFHCPTELYNIENITESYYKWKVDHGYND